MSQINPRVDIAFKKIFGVDENKDLLIALINAVVSEEDRVQEVTLLNPYNQQSFLKDKLSILDIKAVGCHGKRFNIEIQITDEGDYDKRALYYWAKLYADQLKASDDYTKLNKVIGIHILNFTSIANVEKYHNIFHVTEKETGLKYFNDLELHTVELKKFVDSLGPDFDDIYGKIQNALDLWSAFLTKHDLMTPDKLIKNLDNIELKKALKVLEVMNFSEHEREAYENHLKWLRIEANTLRRAEEKGMEKGMEKGLEQGRNEERHAIALMLLKKGLTYAEIAEVTGLAEVDIETAEEETPIAPECF